MPATARAAMRPSSASGAPATAPSAGSRLADGFSSTATAARCAPSAPSSTSPSASVPRRRCATARRCSAVSPRRCPRSSGSCGRATGERPTPTSRAAGEPAREMALARSQGRAANERWHLRKDGSTFWGSGVMLPLADHRRGFLKIFRDRTQERAQEEAQKLLIDELNHRVKNTLATVQSIAAQSLKTSESTAQARESFEARLFALAKAHDVLTRESWEGASLRDIVEEALAAHRAARAARHRHGAARAGDQRREVRRALERERPRPARLARRGGRKRAGASPDL